MTTLAPQHNVVKIESDYNKVYVYRREGNVKLKNVLFLNNYYFLDDDNGKHETIFGKKCKLVMYHKDSKKEKQYAYESDLTTGEHLAITLARHNMLTNPLNYRVCHFDIETLVKVMTDSVK